MPLPRVSIITPVFNSERFLSRYFNNLLLQDYDNLEIVIMDNASTDQSLEIIAEFSNSLDIKVKSEKDKGIYDAMNKGISHSSGEYLLFLGADDRIDGNKTLRTIFENSDSLNCDLIYGKFRFADTNKVRGGLRNDKSILLDNICHQAILYHRRVFSIVGNYDLSYPICADFDLNIRCFLEPKIKKKFLDIVIGCFQSGGVSFAGCDSAFLMKQKRLIIENHGQLRYFIHTYKNKLMYAAKKMGLIT